MRLPFFRQQALLGLDIGSSAIKLVQLKPIGNTYHLVKFGIKALEPELIVDGMIADAARVVSAIKDLLAEQQVKTKHVVMSVSGNAVIIKRVALPQMTEELLAQSIAWEAEPHIPFDMNDVNLDFHVMGPSQAEGPVPQMDVLLVAVKKDKLLSYTQLAMDAGLVPVVVDVDCFALENMYGLHGPTAQTECTAMVNVGAHITTLHILQGGNFSFTRDMTTGSHACNESLQRDFHITYEQAEQALRLEPLDGIEAQAILGTIDRFSMDLAEEVMRSVDYYKSTSDVPPSRILLSGGGAKIPSVCARLQEKIGMEVEIANPFAKIQASPKLFNVDYLREMAPLAAVGVGLALRRTGDR